MSFILYLFIFFFLLCPLLKNISSPERFVEFYRIALDKLHAEVPKAFVQIIPMFDVSPIRHLSTGFVCDIVQR